MGYVCVKPVEFGGTEFHPGDAIPDGTILGTRVRALKSSGHITEAENVEAPPASIGAMRVTFGDGSDPVEVTSDQLQSVINIMSMDAKEAAKAIDDEVDETTLRIISTIESRKTVTEAVSKQMTIISTITS